MELEGKVIQFLGETSGTSKAGKPWKKKEWLVETFGNFPRKVKVQAFGERADQINIIPGNDYVLSIDIESREFNGRWFTDVSVFRVSDYVGNGAQNFGGQPQGNYNSYPQPSRSGVAESMPFGGNQPSFTPSDDDNGEDLPF